MGKYTVRRGFTIVELLVVIVVIGILASLSLVAYNGITSRARITVLQSDLRNAASQLEVAAYETGSYPADFTSAGIRSNSGTEFQYTLNNAASPRNYCLTATASEITYHIATDGKPIIGPCNGHTGTQIADLNCPTGYITVPGNSLFGTEAFCVMKYEARDVSGVATSQPSNTPWVEISQTNAVSTAAAACSGCHLMTENEWMTIAANVLSVSSNWSSGTVGTGYIYQGHISANPYSLSSASANDNDGLIGMTDIGGAGSNARRTLTLTNGEVIWDLSGNVHEWTTSTVASSQHVGLPDELVLAHKQWNNPSLVLSGLPSFSRPSVISEMVAGYSSAQGIGQLYSNYSDTNLRSFMRGGSYGSADGAGVLGLVLTDTPSSTSTSVGFRVAR